MTEGAINIEDYEELKEQLESKENELKEQKDRYLRLLADFDNYKKNQAKRESDLLKYKYESLFKELLPVLDTLEYMEIDKENRNSGFEVLISQMKSVFTNHDVEKINPKFDKFDESESEAVALDNNPKVEDNIITEVWKTGYRYKDKIIRYAQVKVNKI